MAESYTPHSLPILGTNDLIRSPTDDNIRKQINAVATAADTAITAEGARAEGAANDYTDSTGAANRSAWAAADTATLADAKTYTDAQVATDRGRLDGVESKNAAQDVRLDAIAKEAPDDAEFAKITRDQSDRISEATRWDGTKYVPVLEAKRATIAGEVTTEGAAAGYHHIRTDAGGRIWEAARTDGTRYVPVLESDRATVGGSRVGTVTTYIVPLLGQSNNLWTWHLSGRPRVRELDDRLRVWVQSGGEISVVPVTHGESLGLGFAQQFIRDNPNVTVICVPCGEGGTGFIETDKGTWTPGVTPTLGGINFYSRAVDYIRATLAAAPGAQILATLWSQGEADRYGMNQAQYAAALDNLIATLRSDLTVPAMPFILGSLVPEEAASVPQSAGVVAAHEDTPRRLLNTAYIWGPDDSPWFGERIHYSATANALRGGWMARAGLYRARLNVAASLPEPPKGPYIQRSADWARITWDFPPCRATSFTLETSDDKGVTWVPQTLNTAVSTYKELTIDPAKPLWARVSTTNEQGTTIPTTEARA